MRTRRNPPPPAASPPSVSPASGPGQRGPLQVNMPAGKVGTQPATGGDGPDLRLPHERDQSAVDSAAATPDPVMVQAAKDLAAGQVDTDLRNLGGLDDVQRQKLLKRQR